MFPSSSLPAFHTTLFSTMMIASNKKINPEILRFLPDAQEVDSLSGGAVNECFRVKTLTGVFAFRLGVLDPSKYGFDRDQELAFYKEGERLSIAPPLKASDPSKGILVMRCIDGEVVDKEMIRKSGMISKVTSLLQTLHSVESPESSQGKTIQHIRFFLEKLKQLKALPEGWEEFIERSIAEMGTPKKLVLCHNDLAGNLLEEKGRIWAIDWECAGWNDPLFDLAFLCIWYDFSTEEKQNLLSSYYGEIRNEDELNLAIRLGLIFSSLWSLLEVAYGNESYKEQALELYEKAQSLSQGLHLS